MKKLMYKIMLTCKQATFYSSIKSFKKLEFVRGIQLKLHFMACKNCHEFDHQSQVIDQSLVNFHKNNTLQSEEKLSKEKIAELKDLINQRTK
ncbi:MAG: hypothetical protein HQ522_04490 [Bacteroidetes bacterium]|nr:hypothetical protein [Bacteroidota bacterium]